jgi:hypothetical protein
MPARSLRISTMAAKDLGLLDVAERYGHRRRGPGDFTAYRYLARIATRDWRSLQVASRKVPRQEKPALTTLKKLGRVEKPTFSTESALSVTKNAVAIRPLPREADIERTSDFRRIDP